MIPPAKSDTIRIATWNVERPKPKGWKIPPAQLSRMEEVDADIWVLTETTLTHAPPDHPHGVFSPEHPERRPANERWVGIWSRWPLVELSAPAAHKRGSLAALCETPLGQIVVYGTVLAWANEPHTDEGTPTKMWEVHLAEIERQGHDWRTIREAHPDVPLVIAGDFNQDRDGSRWYGTKEARHKLSEQLEASSLTCLTAVDVVAEGMLEAQHLIDHVCSTAHLTMQELQCWETHDDSGIRLSDHPTVAVDLSLQRRA